MKLFNDMFERQEYFLNLSLITFENDNSLLRIKSNHPINVINKAKKLANNKPRTSDAVLSCPCCFNILSMDCQQHHRYKNQFRAMFVMGITVDWEHRLIYDDKVGGLVRFYQNPQQLATNNNTSQDAIPNNNNNNNNNNNQHCKIVAPDHQEEAEIIYYAVACANCQTSVAALDMTDEVYHFYDCLASS